MNWTPCRRRLDCKRPDLHLGGCGFEREYADVALLPQPAVEIVTDRGSIAAALADVEDMPPAVTQPRITPLGSAISAVIAERERQEQLKAAGRFRYTLADAGMTDMERLAALMEEVGEVGRALLERDGAVNDHHGAKLRTELVQVAAVCVAWVERLDINAAGES